MKKQEEGRINLPAYLFDKLIGSFTGFVIGLWAAGLVSHFFATRSIKNLWGLASKKTIVDKQTFSILEWLASALIGYIVFEIVIRLVKIWFSPLLERGKVKMNNWLSQGRFRNFAGGNQAKYRNNPT